jgi:serine/threonine protein kinase
MEYVKGGPTMKIEPDTQPLPEETAKKYFCDIVNGLEYCKRDINSARINL